MIVVLFYDQIVRPTQKTGVWQRGITVVLDVYCDSEDGSDDGDELVL